MNVNGSIRFVVTPPWALRLRRLCERVARWTRKFDKLYPPDAHGAPDYSTEIKETYR